MAATATGDDVSNASAPVDEENAAAAAQTDNASNADAQPETLQEGMGVQDKAMKCVKTLRNKIMSLGRVTHIIALALAQSQPKHSL